MADREVWGFTITTNPAGKNVWPNDLKREAVRRMEEDGDAPGDIAAELGAHECLVRKWGVAARRARGDRIFVAEPAFAEISVSDPPKAPTAPATSEAQMGRLRVGKLCLEFPVSIPETVVRRHPELEAGRFRLAEPGQAEIRARPPWGRRSAYQQSWRRRPHGKARRKRSLKLRARDYYFDKYRGTTLKSF